MFGLKKSYYAYIYKEFLKKNLINNYATRYLLKKTTKISSKYVGLFIYNIKEKKKKKTRRIFLFSGGSRTDIPPPIPGLSAIHGCSSCFAWPENGMFLNSTVVVAASSID